MASRDFEETKKHYAEINTYLQREIEYLKSIGDLEGVRARQSEIVAERQRMINTLLSEQATQSNKRTKAYKENQKLLDSLILKQRENIENEKKLNAQLESGIKKRQRIVDFGKEITNQLKIGWGYLQQQDKTIKSTILTLGLSGTKADLMRQSFEESAAYVARLGGSLEDVQTIMTGFADETGRARVLSAQMIQDVTAIGRGTGLGVEQATKLAAQFEFMGVDTKATMDYVQGVVDTSERMGVNTTKVLKAVSDNFKKLSTFTFQAGVKAFGQMAMDAEKTRVSMSTALNVAEATRGLEAVIELGANLQVMGGEFAKMDPLRWLYMVRNEPEKINEEISKMTAGIYTLRKNSEGVFEKFISPADRDRLTSVAKSLGISNEKIFEIAQRRHDLSLMENEMAGMGLTPREKELIQGAAQFNTDSGKHQVKLAGTMQDISTLTKQQASAFAKEQVLLQDRAREALTFDEVFKATINELKSTLLPLLNNINKVLVTFKKASDYVVDKFKTLGPLLSGVGLIAAAILLKGAGMFLTKSLDNFVSRGALFKGAGKGGATSTRTGAQALGEGKGAGLAARGAGMKALGTGVGIGAAGLGVGAGIGIGAKGIGELAQSLKDVDIEKIRAMNTSLIILGGTMVAMGIAGNVGAVGLAVAGAAALAIGFGISLAAKGIGEMAEKLGKMGEVTGSQLLGIAGGISAIGLSLMTFGNPLSILGMGIFAATMLAVSAGVNASINAAASFERMGIAMKGTKDDWIAVQNAIEGISKANIKGGGFLGELATLLKEPLKVQFADNDVQIRSNVTLDIDRATFMNKIFDAEIAIEKIDAVRRNKAGRV